MTRWMWRALCGALAVLLLGAVTPGDPGVARADLGVPLPADDPFYAPPDGFAGTPNGTVLRSREVTVVAIAFPVPATAHQVLYKSVDSHGRAVAEAVTVVVPLGAWPGPGPRPLVAYQLAEDSLSTRCQPSYTLRVGIGSPTPAGTYEVTQSLGALARGYAVAYADYEGPDSDFMAGPQAAHAVLDGIRAAQHFPPAGLSPDGPVALWGYSGGGFATTWAAEQQPTYAPELRLVGAAAGGVPAELHAMLDHNDGNLGAGLDLLGVMGLARAFPEAGVAALLNDAGRALFAANADNCTLDVALFHPFDHLANYTTVPNPSDSPAAHQLYQLDDPGRAVPAAPFYSYQGLADEFVPVAPADALVRGYCAGGGVVTSVRIPLAGHLGAEAVGASGALDFLTARFTGQPARDDCA